MFREPKLFVTPLPEIQAQSNKIRGSIDVHWSHSGTMARENNTEHPSTSSPGVSKTNAPPCRGSEQVVGIRLPRHFAVKLANVLVLDVRVRREINSDYSFVHVSTSYYMIETYCSRSDSLRKTGVARCPATSF